MSALRILVHAMRTLIASTATVLTAVHVERDLLEMEHFAEVFG